MDKLKRAYPAGKFHPILITEVTRMSGGYFCVAAWDIHGERIVRPLQPNGSNWQLGNDRSVFYPGHLLNCSPTGRSHGIYPHRTEDLILAATPTILERFGEAETYHLLIDKTDPNIVSIFGQPLIDDKYIVEGTNCRSLGSVRARQRHVSFHVSFSKLRLQLLDTDGSHYDLPVTSDELRRVFSPRDNDPEPHFGVEEANEWLRVNDPNQELILRVGLARGWAGSDGSWSPKRCYLQLNGIICPQDNWHIFAG